MYKIIAFLFIGALLLAACNNQRTQTTDKDQGNQNLGKENTTQPEPAKELTPLEKLSLKLKESAKVGVEVEDTTLNEIVAQLKPMFPSTENELEGYKWDISAYKNKDDSDVFISADLSKEMDGEEVRAMWFHILYDPSLSQDERENYGTETFEGYKASIAEDAHVWVLVNNVEIRAVADSEEFSKTDKIKSVVKSFNLKELEKL